MNIIKLNIPLKESDVRALHVGDRVSLDGIIYITRDLGHRRILEYLQEGKALPLDLQGAVIYHAGPVVKQRDQKWEILNCGPTSSVRMSVYSPTVIKAGVSAIVGKSSMDDVTLKAMGTYGAIFLAAYSVANVHAQQFEEVLNVHWLDLGTTEAIWVIRVKNWGPLIVAMDSFGENLYSKIIQNAKAKIDKFLP
jgi:fumarate hydratase subunit beta